MKALTAAEARDAAMRADIHLLGELLYEQAGPRQGGAPSGLIHASSGRSCYATPVALSDRPEVP